MPQHIDIHKEFARFINDKKLEQAAYIVSQKLAEGHTCLDVDIRGIKRKVQKEKTKNLFKSVS